MWEQEGYDRTGVPWKDRRAFCSILKAQMHRFEMPVTDLCDRAYVDSREGPSTSPPPPFLRAPSSRDADVRFRCRDALHIADVPMLVANVRRLGCNYLTRVNARAKRARVSRSRSLASSAKRD